MKSQINRIGSLLNLHPDIYTHPGVLELVKLVVAERMQATTEQEPVAYLRFWAWQSLSPDGGVEADGGYEVCRKGDVDVDGSPAFAVFDHPAPQHKPLSKDGVQAVLTEAVRGGKLSWMGFSRDSDGQYTIPILSPYHYQIARAIEKSPRHRSRHHGGASMKLSELIEEFVDMKVSGEPKDSDWASVDTNFQRRHEYWARLAELRLEIDTATTKEKS